MSSQTVTPDNRSSRILYLSGLLLTSIGAVLALAVSILVLDRQLQSQVVDRADLLTLPNTPEFALLPVTQTPRPTPTITLTPSPTPSPSPSPTPAPPIRIRIPYIALNSLVVDVKPEVYTNYSGILSARWTVPGYAVGHFFDSGNPGSGTNIVLSGHNNFLGEVFRDLYLLKPGIEVILYAPLGEFRYTITEITIVPYVRNPARAEEVLRTYMAPTTSEQVTIISCYPYLTNADRIVVVAKPSQTVSTESATPPSP